MRISRIVVAWTLIIFLVGAFTAPRRAEALSSGEIAAIVVGSIVGWFALVAIGAAIVYHKPTPKQTNQLAPGRSPDDPDATQRRVRFGPECPADTGPLAGVRPTLCW